VKPQKTLVKLNLIIGLFSCTKSVVEASDFSIQFRSNYSIKTTSEVSVTENITITNNSDLKYPVSYNLTIPTQTIKGLKVTDQKNANILPDVISTDSGTSIYFKLKVPVIGKNKSQTINLEYLAPDLLVSENEPLQLAIPPLIVNDKELTRTVNVLIPSQICPDPYASQSYNYTDQGSISTFSFENVKSESPVFLGCGHTRYVALNLKYFLSNPNITPVETQITLPPDTDRQRLIFDEITPPPINLFTDAENNVIATYHLEPKDQKTINVVGRASISNTSDPNYPTQTRDRSYLSEQPHWPIKDKDIKKSADVLNNPEEILNFVKSESDMFVRSKFRGGDIGNVDMFISLLRAKGIMSRKVIGFAQSSNPVIRPQAIPQESLHVWAEFFDLEKNSWIPVDVAWAKRSLDQQFFPILDLNHLILAINGSNDSIPYPTGIEVNVNTIPKFEFPPPILSAEISRSLMNQLSRNANINIILKNDANLSFYSEEVSIIADSKNLKTVNLPRLPIKGYAIIPFTLPKNYENLKLQIQSTEIPITTGQEKHSVTLALSGIVAAIASIIAVVSGRLLVSRFKK